MSYIGKRPEHSEPHSKKNTPIKEACSPVCDPVPLLIREPPIVQQSFTEAILPSKDLSLAPDKPSFSAFKVTWPLEDPVEAHMFRFFVEIIAPSPLVNLIPAGNEGQSHLSTFELYTIPYYSPSSSKSGVGAACYFAQLRCEVNTMLLKGEPPQGVYGSFPQNLIRPKDEVTWSNRLAWLTTRIAQWATLPKGSREEWEELVALVNEWETSRPATFSPFFYREEDMSQGRYFPDIWFSSPCHSQYLP
ncbi:hypothetical protein P154DRAFT_564353 [Amniculicola lignicola CBS 123094]|uniref:Uncharacterized protein n=1 Tax=Amniculicola lignicola CBS 123094 TaxID=1392246 RepID=A0A6A5WBG4_9PLEO|nr:hypothetical protein P154DRAFT_564353 [Amniculicola lignicola CBS 123094]